MERALHFKFVQSVSENWIFVWALCKRSGGFYSFRTTSTVQAKAEQGWLQAQAVFQRLFKAAFRGHFV